MAIPDRPTTPNEEYLNAILNAIGQGGGGEDFIVNVEVNGEDDYTSDKTNEEIYEAFNSGKTIKLRTSGASEYVDDNVFYLITCTQYYADFYCVWGYSDAVTINNICIENDYVSAYYNQRIVGIPNSTASDFGKILMVNQSGRASWIAIDQFAGGNY